MFMVFYGFLSSLLQEIAWLTGKAEVIIDSEYLTIAKYFWGLKFSAKYDISKISNFTIEDGVTGKWVLYGTNPIFTKRKPLIKDPTVLSYSYEGKTKSFGSHLKDFPSESIIKEVEMRQKNLK